MNLREVPCQGLTGTHLHQGVVEWGNSSHQTPWFTPSVDPRCQIPSWPDTSICQCTPLFPAQYAASSATRMATARTPFLANQPVDPVGGQATLPIFVSCAPCPKNVKALIHPLRGTASSISSNARSKTSGSCMVSGGIVDCSSPWASHPGGFVCCGCCHS